jgi:hypothetical protein
MLVAGVVNDPSGRPVAGARVYFTSGPGGLPDIAGLTDARGAFTLTAPGAGNYELACAADGYATANVSVAVRTGQDARVTIALEPNP